MTKQETINWFIQMCKFCYPIVTDKYKNSIFWIYDKSYVRNIKLAKLSNQEIKYPTKIKGHCVFEQDTEFNKLWCDCEYIWMFIEDNYSIDYDTIIELIDRILRKETLKCNKHKETSKYNLFNTIHYYSCGLDRGEVPERTKDLTKFKLL